MEEKCTCPIKPKMSKAEIIDKIIRPRLMCTDVEGKRWMCPTLSREIRRAEGEEVWRRQRAKTLKKAGYSKEEIESMPRRRRRTKNNVGKFQPVDLGI